ncbi:DUF2157 domain-containing protein [Sphingomonas colocasiae]|uniref:DUF2157 domain-containing protein n=1 Tax=Sphingomonas colocasiae TaxID=1848973 RepID=A0ABS7PVJ3_9SPHN|nr:DUF2157 domain-containing protein [Sphingomonas colocasiae]MBY8825291.1 DUF2157 domain-containing protein [Sphingomonas colocasiae]
MSRFRTEVLDWLGAGRAVAGREREVLRIADVTPSPADWRTFLGHLTLWLGTVALAAAVIFFFAFNWADLGRFAKFGLVEAAILAGLLACWRLDLDGMPGKAMLVMLSLLTGALLALSGQIYQTGADTYELFAWWAVLILPWVTVSRFSPLWLIWLALINLALFFYFSLSRSADPLLWSMFALNTAALILWEAAHRAGLSWLRDNWPPRLVSIAAGCGATALAVWAIFESDEIAGMRALAALAYLAWLAALYGWYRHCRPDLFMLAGGVLSLIVTVAAFLTHHMVESGSGAFLLIGLVVIGMSAGGAIWLKSVSRAQAA